LNVRILSKTRLEDCFVESLTSELQLDGEITPSFIHYLGREGELQYFPAFARPFFRVDAPGLYTLTGIQGNRTLRVTLCHDNKLTGIQRLERLVLGFPDEAS